MWIILPTEIIEVTDAATADAITKICIDSIVGEAEPLADLSAKEKKALKKALKLAKERG